MNDLEREVRDTLLRHQNDAPPFDLSDARRVVGRARRRQVRNVVVGGIVGAAAVIVAIAGLGGLVRADRPPTVLDRPSPSPTCMATPGLADAEVVHGWPGTSRNPAGVYSFDAEREGFVRNGNVRFMHNGYRPGSGDLSILFKGIPGRLIPHRGQTAVTVAGCEGTYRRFIGDDGPSEEWMVDIEGTTVTIRLTAEPGAPEGEVAEAHGIIESIRAEPQENDLGFWLVFTLTTDTWDSG